MGTCGYGYRLRFLYACYIWDSWPYVMVPVCSSFSLTCSSIYSTFFSLVSHSLSSLNAPNTSASPSVIISLTWGLSGEYPLFSHLGVLLMCSPVFCGLFCYFLGPLICPKALNMSASSTAPVALQLANICFFLLSTRLASFDCTHGVLMQMAPLLCTWWT